jgi:hypothetical protein
MCIYIYIQPKTAAPSHAHNNHTLFEQFYENLIVWTLWNLSLEAIRKTTWVTLAWMSLLISSQHKFEVWTNFFFLTGNKRPVGDGIPWLRKYWPKYWPRFSYQFITSFKINHNSSNLSNLCDTEKTLPVIFFLSDNR